MGRPRCTCASWQICAASLVLLGPRDQYLLLLPHVYHDVPFRWCYRNRSEVVDDALTDRRHTPARLGASGCLCIRERAFSPGFNHLYFFIGMIWNRGTEMRARSASGEVYVDEDDHWRKGLYYNPDDAVSIVNERVRMINSMLGD